MPTYPDWKYYPAQDRPPEWVAAVIAVFAAAHGDIAAETGDRWVHASEEERVAFFRAEGERGTRESRNVEGLTSGRVLARLRPGLEALGFAVQGGKQRAERIRRPVLFGDQGVERVSYEVDAVHDELGILVEIEAGRGARGNAFYRDLVRSSLVVDAQYLVLGVISEYRHQRGGRPVTVASYREATDLLDAIYASGRLQLPFEGVLLVGY